ncbi:peptidase [Halothiobacillus diazotrophicus]|uniref:Peptidase n=1 Tax=Halothiobacillus diazotrophicus TaxID=1860122 RepID=A0A191ZGG2_9GAMM|nr:C39 family peptidase [Halothiobacillus diazotrophicus]ANJ66942.1 peptidase [Halothiobacillus diazotrophicus]
MRRLFNQWLVVQRASKKSQLATVTLVVLLTAGGMVGAPARAAEIRFGDILPNGAILTKPVISMQERRYLNVVRQQYDFSCGAAALATILRYAYGLRLGEETVLSGMLGVANPELVRTRGFSLLDMKEYLAELGYRGRGYRIDLARLESIHVPTIVLMNVNGYNHFVVLKSVSDGYVHIADPALGNRRYPLAKFLETWPSRTIFAVIGPGFDRHTALLDATDIPSAKNLQERSGGVPKAELLDFGFTHADLF